MILDAIKKLPNVTMLGDVTHLNSISSVSVDSRTIQQNALFVALVANRNGHDFVADAISKGVQAVLISEWREEYNELKSKATFLIVHDTNQALIEIAQWFRKNVLKCEVVAITGSYGKTTVKEMVASILKTLGDGLVSPGNYNNLIGIPLTLMNSKPYHQFAVFELGMNRYNEIAKLTRLVQPTIGMITHIGTSHMAYFGSKWGIAQAKHELFDEMKSDAIRLYNLDDEFLLEYYHNDPFSNKIGYTFDSTKANISSNVIFAKRGQPDENMCYEIEVENVKIKSPLEGEHQMENLLSAAIIAKVMNVPMVNITAALQKMQKSEYRNNIVYLGPITLIRDEYNASRNSILAGLRLLKKISNGRKTIAVLGDVYELGEFSKEEHINIAKDIEEMEIDEVYLAGQAMLYAYEHLKKNKHKAVFYQKDPIDWVEQVYIASKTGAAILVKGSRGMKMEAFSENFIKKFHTSPSNVK
ncbi:MAG: UDP-N-acetylmuramoyl-tripeptide--D-alanyl-D-alanine ligase [bacterium]|nr:UDP-N-acetylmuramoyl-tripeptide--D-alanyl-D-alanine ligase [bacterium]